MNECELVLITTLLTPRVSDFLPQSILQLSGHQLDVQ